MPELDGKVVVVTGAARGQGAAEVAALAAAGATVVATDVLDFEEPAPEGVTERRLDVTDEAGWAELAEWLLATYGRVDALVNNAGVAARERLPDVTLETWHLPASDAWAEKLRATTEQTEGFLRESLDRVAELVHDRE